MTLQEEARCPRCGSYDTKRAEGWFVTGGPGMRIPSAMRDDPCGTRRCSKCGHKFTPDNAEDKAERGAEFW